MAGIEPSSSLRSCLAYELLRAACASPCCQPPQVSHFTKYISPCIVTQYISLAVPGPLGATAETAAAKRVRGVGRRAKPHHGGTDARRRRWIPTSRTRRRRRALRSARFLRSSLRRARSSACSRNSSPASRCASRPPSPPPPRTRSHSGPPACAAPTPPLPTCRASRHAHSTRARSLSAALGREPQHLHAKNRYVAILLICRRERKCVCARFMCV